MHAQTYLAQTSFGQDLGPSDRVKIICVRSEAVAASKVTSMTNGGLPHVYCGSWTATWQQGRAASALPTQKQTFANAIGTSVEGQSGHFTVQEDSEPFRVGPP